MCNFYGNDLKRIEPYIELESLALASQTQHTVKPTHMAKNSWCNTSIWGDCVSRGEAFTRASARHCLTFPHGVFSALRLSSRSFFSSTQWKGFTDRPRWLHIAKAQYYHGELPTPPWESFMVIQWYTPVLCEKKWKKNAHAISSVQNSQGSDGVTESSNLYSRNWNHYSNNEIWLNQS